MKTEKQVKNLGRKMCVGPIGKVPKESINQEIDKLQEQGKTVILIDDIFLQHQKCYKDISLIFLDKLVLPQ